MDTLMKKLPVIALRGVCIVPQMVTHIDVSRSASVHAVERAMLNGQRLFVVTQRDAQVDNPALDDLYEYGTVCIVKQIMKLPNKVVRILLEGEEKGRLQTLEDANGYLIGDIIGMRLLTEEPEDLISEAMHRQLKQLVQRLVQLEPRQMKEVASHLAGQETLAGYMEQMAAYLPMPYTARQQYLNAAGLEERYQALVQMLSEEIQIADVQRQLQSETQKRVDKHQREYILREQQRIITEELDGKGGELRGADQYREQLSKLEADEEVISHIRREIGRFQAAGPASAEGSVLRGYLDTMFEMPWNVRREEQTDITAARKILEADHYGLEKVKERVLEFLAARMQYRKKHPEGDMDAPILCLVGPPGTGKTSIARSVARALNKEYVRICLGGVRDEAEIRGHRKTYVGAMPGRIAEGLRKAGVKNPLMLLDEIDKMSNDYKGDPSSALLEVLDGEQNRRFVDHYIEAPIDLSEVLFIATANTLQTVPKPLLDRMEIIELTSYTDVEKLHIAKRYLLPRQIEHNGLEKVQLHIPDGAMKEIIASYTREAGVRELERKLGQVCRKAVIRLMEHPEKKLKVNKRDLSAYLGTPKYHQETAAKKPRIGVVNGLAWTSVGGDTLQVEAVVMPGKGDISLTGQMGDVMKESAQAGISYLRSVSEQYALGEDYFNTHDIHVHIPEGAVPKDGPSAGITMATAMLSAMAKKPVRGDLAMTGEITLTGRVLPIGGLKEKSLAAKKAGIYTLIVPEENKPDVAELEKEITSGMTFQYVKTVGQVLDLALVQE